MDDPIIDLIEGFESPLERQVAELRGKLKAFEEAKRCTCGKILSADEIKYYGGSCNECERIGLLEQQLDDSQHLVKLNGIAMVEYADAAEVFASRMEYFGDLLNQ